METKPPWSRELCGGYFLNGSIFRREMKLNLHESGKVLVADDQACYLNPLAATLIDRGYEVVTAQNGREALGAIDAFRPDVLLLDVMMPEMDGFEVCAAVKENPLHQDVPIIFMSAAGDSTSITCGFELGAVDFVPKPFNRVEMLARVRTHLLAYRARCVHRERLREQARMLSQRADEWAVIAEALLVQLRYLSPESGSDAVDFRPIQQAEHLARDITRFARNARQYTDPPTLHALQNQTNETDLNAILGELYLRAKRMGRSFTMTHRSAPFIVDVSPNDLRNILEPLAALIIERMPEGADCQASVRRSDHGNIFVKIACLPSPHLHSETESPPLDIPPHVVQLAEQLDVRIQSNFFNGGSVAVTIELPIRLVL